MTAGRMNPRQMHAITHPIGRADGDPRDLRALTADRRHATGVLLRTILAVDR